MPIKLLAYSIEENFSTFSIVGCFFDIEGLLILGKLMLADCLINKMQYKKGEKRWWVCTREWQQNEDWVNSRPDYV